MKPIRLLIADDHAVFRNALNVLLSQEADFNVVAEADCEAQALDALGRHTVDVLVLDMSIPPGMAGPRIAKAAAKAQPKLAIVVLTMHDDRCYVQDMFRLGASAYVLKKSAKHELFRAIRDAHRGQRYIDPALVDQAVSNFTGSVSPSITDSNVDALTPREQEVCRLLAYGHTNGEIAEMLSISERTVQTHRQNLMSKLRLKSRAELVGYAMAQGLFTPPT